MRQKTFQLYEQYQSEITYVEGDLTWIANLGDTVDVIEAIAPPNILAYEKTKNETEYYVGEYLPAKDVYTAEALFRLPDAGDYQMMLKLKHTSLKNKNKGFMSNFMRG